MFAPFRLKTYLKLGQLFHQLLLLLGVAQRGDDVEEHLQQVQTLSGHVGQSEDRRDAARKTQQRLMFKTEIRIEKTKKQNEPGDFKADFSDDEHHRGQLYAGKITIRQQQKPTESVSQTHLGDWANCCAAVTASSLPPMTMGTLLQPGCFSTRSSCRTVRSTVARVHRSTLLMTMKMGTLRAMAMPRCSRVVPAVAKKKSRERGGRFTAVLL